MSAVKKLQANESVKTASRNSFAQSNRILVVDDEPEILKAYKDILQPQQNVTALRSSRLAQKTEKSSPIGQFEVVTVSTGEAAIEAVKESLAENKPFAMGFFDVLLGSGIDGIETVRQIHLLQPKMYAVLVTAYQDRHVDSIGEIFGEKFQDRWDYLNKPFSEGEIIQKARSMVAMWNIRTRDAAQRLKLDQLMTKMLETEKLSTVAAVSRNIGHEFGNILLQIMGLAELSAKKTTLQEMKTGFESILLASEHASQILSKFKDLSSPTENEEQFETLSIKELVDTTLALMNHEFKKRSVTSTANIDSELHVYGERTSIVQVLMNLAINSLHAIGNAGTLTIEAKLNGENVEIHVIDSGPGIPKGLEEKIFQAFYTTKGNQGTGLGLSICKEIIEVIHGGELSVSNSKSGGADFKILIPVKKGGDHESK